MIIRCYILEILMRGSLRAEKDEEPVLKAQNFFFPAYLFLCTETRLEDLDPCACR